MCDTTARLDGKTVIITGGSSGMGLEAAKNLASRGARVIIASRNETKLMKASQEIQIETDNSNIAYGILDLASLNSVRNFASNTINSEPRLDILIDNAGALGLPDIMTEDGLNLTMQVNYFGSFLLTYLLLPLLKKSSPSRIIIGTAASMYFGDLDFDHWNDIGRYTWVEGLANSKLADALLAVELSRRLQGSNVTANSFDPFVVRDTDILANVPGWLNNISRKFIDIIGQPKEEVGNQIAYLAAEPELHDTSGAHYKFCSKWLNHWLTGDKELATMLWDESKRLVRITPQEDWEIASS
jgi:NAD(P)-dependent dehydrogenase (short-subunit alcohol dehydrogenase family)